MIAIPVKDGNDPDCAPTASVGIPAEVGLVDHRVTQAVQKAILDALALANSAGLRVKRLTTQTVRLEDGSHMITCRAEGVPKLVAVDAPR